MLNLCHMNGISRYICLGNAPGLRRIHPVVHVEFVL